MVPVPRVNSGRVSSPASTGDGISSVSLIQLYPLGFGLLSSYILARLNTHCQLSLLLYKPPTTSLLLKSPRSFSVNPTYLPPSLLPSMGTPFPPPTSRNSSDRTPLIPTLETTSPFYCKVHNHPTGIRPFPNSGLS